MDFKFSFRPYSGKQFRPTPEVHQDEKSLIIATPWGQRDSAKKVIAQILNYLMICNEDREATTPFQRLSCLSTSANNLRIAILLANETLFRGENNEEYKSGVELFAMIRSEGELVWLQIGQPQIFLLRENRSVISLGGSMDLAFDLSNEFDLLPSLPNQLLGLDSSLNLTINSFRPQAKDKILLLSHSQVPSEIYNIESQNLKLDQLSKTLSERDPQLAFWLGIAEF
jgi:hypothetical protein